MKKNKLPKKVRLLRKLFYICCFTLMFSQYGESQEVPFVDELSYKHTESHRLALPNGTSFDDLHAYDMPSLEYKEMSHQLEKSLDENGNPQTIKTVISGVNFYEDWQRLAKRWLFNSNGTTLYEESGKGRNKSYKQIDFIEYSRMGLDMYENTKAQVRKFGYLSSLVFPSEIRKVIGNNTQGGTLDGMNEPYVVAPDGSLVMTNTGGEYVIFQVLDSQSGSVGIIKYIKYESDPNDPVFPVIPDENDPGVIQLSVSVFDKEICDQLVLTNTTDVEKEILFNGICAKRIVENTYSDYKFECDETGLRSSDENDLVQGDLTLSPNPLRSNLLAVSLPFSLNNQEVKLIISNLSGQKLGELNQVVNGNLLQVNIGEILTTQGLYIISVQTPDYVGSKKLFYTQN